MKDKNIRSYLKFNTFKSANSNIFLSYLNDTILDTLYFVIVNEVYNFELYRIVFLLFLVYCYTLCFLVSIAYGLLKCRVLFWYRLAIKEINFHNISMNLKLYITRFTYKKLTYSKFNPQVIVRII